MKIAQLYGQGRPVFSFEFFPPRTDEAAEELFEAVQELKDRYRPDLISVTYGAGGSTRERGVNVVRRIQNEIGVTTLAHLTCVGHTSEELDAVVDELPGFGIENVLALRGDPPKGETGFVATEGGFGHATGLIGG